MSAIARWKEAPRNFEGVPTTIGPNDTLVPAVIDEMLKRLEQLEAASRARISLPEEAK